MDNRLEISMEKVLKELVFRTLTPEINLTEEDQRKYEELEKEKFKLSKELFLANDSEEKDRVHDKKNKIRKQQQEILSTAEDRLRRQLGLSPKHEANKMLNDYLEFK